MQNIVYYLLSIAAVLIILTIHEYSHGYAAYKLGDNTARNLGRLSLNPIKHLDPIGALCMVFFHFGWAKPVPINPRYFKNPKRDFALVAMAGPLSNVILSFFSAFLYLLLNRIFSEISFSSEFLLQLATNTIIFVYIFHTINLGLGLFNLIPIPPLDGSRILTAILPAKLYFGIMKHERKIYFALIAWLFLGSYLSSFLLTIPTVSATPILRGIAEALSLSSMLGKLISLISSLMIKFWQLIPFLKF